MKYLSISQYFKKSRLQYCTGHRITQLSSSQRARRPSRLLNPKKYAQRPCRLLEPFEILRQWSDELLPVLGEVNLHGTRILLWSLTKADIKVAELSNGNPRLEAGIKFKSQFHNKPNIIKLKLSLIYFIFRIQKTNHPN